MLPSDISVSTPSGVCRPEELPEPQYNTTQLPSRERTPLCKAA